MTTLSQLAQLELEFINRARMDPLAEMKRAGLTTLNDFIAPGTISADPKQVLAGNNQLTAAAVGHLNTELALNQFGHFVGGTKPADRIAAAGYTGNTAARIENFGGANANATFGGANPIIPTRNEYGLMLAENAHLGLFNDKPGPNIVGEAGGHRMTFLDPNLKEVGIGVDLKYASTANSVSGNLNLIENFGVHGTQSFITGAVYNDINKDNFYSLGEAVANVSVTLRNAATGAVVGTGDRTGDGGGWSIGENVENGGTFKVTFSGAGKGDVSATIEAGALNAKMDLVNGNEIYANANTTLNEGAVGLRLIGIQNINGTGNSGNNTITGNTGNNILTGAGGNDVMDGLGGTDTAVFTGKMSDYKIVLNGNSATIEDLRAGSPDGIDTISNVELVRFAGTDVAFTALKNQIPQAPIAGSVSIADVSIAEGDAGSKTMIFKVTRAGGTAAFDVNFAAVDGLAKASDGDYSLAPGSLRFAANETEKFISVTINGDTKFEGDETFSINLSNATNGAKILDGTAIGTIQNDDANHAPVVTGKNVTVAAGGSVAASSIFTAQDADGNSTLSKYAFWDGGKNGGFFTIDGVAQAPGQWIEVGASDLGKVKYVGSVNGGAESIYAKAFDGNVWSAFVQVNATTLQRAADDFSNDGASDILFHNAKTGGAAIWQMDNLKIIGNNIVGTQVTSFHAVDAFDFSGDGKADILWEGSNGQAQLWQMDGSKVLQKLDLGSQGAGWHVGAVDDFNGDGKAEVLWYSDKGQLQMWNMNGASHTTSNVGTIAAGWSIQDSADFNGDGKADLLVRSGSNVSMWQMDGATVSKQSNYTMGDAFHFAGTGDFNGDGKADILWHNDINNQVALWQMDGANILKNSTIGFTAKGWDVASVGDFNHDGHADILLRDAVSGNLAQWQMDGDHIQDNKVFGMISTDWHVI